MKRILILSIGLLFAGELEVDGVIKANSGIDANNNPITNVGSPLTMSDAINGNVLQDALRDEGQYQYIIFYVYIYTAGNGAIDRAGFKRLDEDDFTPSANNYLRPINTFNTEVALLFNDSWELSSINGVGQGSGGGGSWWIFKRPIEE